MDPRGSVRAVEVRALIGKGGETIMAARLVGLGTKLMGESEGKRDLDQDFPSVVGISLCLRSHVAGPFDPN